MDISFTHDENPSLGEWWVSRLLLASWRHASSWCLRPINPVASDMPPHANMLLRSRFWWKSHWNMLKVHRDVSCRCPGCYWRGGAMLEGDACDHSNNWLFTSFHTAGADSAPLSDVYYIHISCFWCIGRELTAIISVDWDLLTIRNSCCTLLYCT